MPGYGVKQPALSMSEAEFSSSAIRLPIIYVVYYLKKGKINYIKLRAKAITLASEGYPHFVIGEKLQRSSTG